jgi:hypothetical protein
MSNQKNEKEEKGFVRVKNLQTEQVFTMTKKAWKNLDQKHRKGELQRTNEPITYSVKNPVQKTGKVR